MVSFPSIPFAFNAFAFEAELAETFVASENSEALFVREQALVVLLLDVRHGFEELAEQEIVAPLDGVLGVSAVARALLVGEQFRVALVDGQSILSRARGFKLDEPCAQRVLPALHGVFFEAMGDEGVERQHAVTLKFRRLLGERLRQKFQHTANLARLGTGGVEVHLRLIHGVQVGIADVAWAAVQFGGGHLRGDEVVGEAGVREIASRKERMLRQILDKGAHLAGHGVALLLGLQARAVLQAQEHLAHFILTRVGEDDDIEVVIVEAMAEFLRQILVVHLRYNDAIDVVGILGQTELAAVELEDRAQALLAIHHFVLLGRLDQLAPIQLGDVVAAQDGINQ